MTRQTPRRNVARSEFHHRLAKAKTRLAAMKREMEADFDAAAILAIQAAIAACDAFTTHYLGVESRSDRHEDALKVLSRVPRVEGLAEAGRHLAELLKAKSSIEYGGAELKPDEAARIAAHATRFVAFVEEKLPK